MILKVGYSYKIILKINNTTLTYSCKIIDVDENFVFFVDKFGKKYTYNKNLIIAIEEIEDGWNCK